MHDVIVPQLNANDSFMTLTEWCVPSGTEVKAGDCLAVVETSKAAQDLEAEHAGFLVCGQQAGAQVSPGSVIGRLCPDHASYKAFLRDSRPDTADGEPAGAEPPAGFVLTDAARELAARGGVSTEALRSLGRRIVRGEDVEQLIRELNSAAPAAQDADDARAPLAVSQQQAAIARTVSLSHREIPDASLTMRVDVSRTLAEIARPQHSSRGYVGLVELLLKAVGELREPHPRCFAVRRGDIAWLPPGAQIAVTIDTGTGLFLPVLRDADNSSVAEIAASLMRMRRKAMRRRFEAADLEGANIAVSLHVERGVVTAVPIIPPSLTAAIALCATQQEVTLDAKQRPALRHIVHVGLAYDHRVVNGRHAMVFLGALRDRLEDPGFVRAALSADAMSTGSTSQDGNNQGDPVRR